MKNLYISESSFNLYESQQALVNFKGKIKSIIDHLSPLLELTDEEISNILTAHDWFDEQLTIMDTFASNTSHFNSYKRDVIDEGGTKKKRDRCLRIADRKYDKPSAYKSGAVVRCRKGDIWKNIK